MRRLAIWALLVCAPIVFTGPDGTQIRCMQCCFPGGMCTVTCA